MTRDELKQLFAAEAPRLLRGLRDFRGRVVPEDVVQTAFLKLRETETEITDPKAYLAQLTRNLAIDETRRARRAPVTFVAPDAFEASPSSELTPEEMLIEGERFSHMLGFVLSLPKRERLALLMCKLKGMSHEEIGAALGVSRHSVPRYLSRALAKCAAAMQAFETAGTGETNHAKQTGRTHRT